MKIRFGKMTGQNTFAGCFRVFGEIEKKKTVFRLLAGHGSIEQQLMNLIIRYG